MRMRRCKLKELDHQRVKVLAVVKTRELEVAKQLLWELVEPLVQESEKPLLRGLLEQEEVRMVDQLSEMIPCVRGTWSLVERSRMRAWSQ